MGFGFGEVLWGVEVGEPEGLRGTLLACDSLRCFGRGGCAPARGPVRDAKDIFESEAVAGSKFLSDEFNCGKKLEVAASDCLDDVRRGFPVD